MANDDRTEDQVSTDANQPGPEQAPPPANSTPVDRLDGQAPDDDYDKERALHTIRQQRKSEELLQKTAHQQERELKELRARLAAIEEEKLSEDQKREKRTQETTARAAELERQLEQERQDRRRERTRHVVEIAATQERRDKTGNVTRPAFHRPDEAYALLNQGAIEYDDDGQPTNIEALLAELATERPHLVKHERGDIAAGLPTNPSRQQTSTEQPESRSGWRNRFYGAGSDLFDPQSAASRGGGVVYPEQSKR